MLYGLRLHKHALSKIVLWHLPHSLSYTPCVLLTMFVSEGAHVSVQYVPVDTIICFRASMPLVIAVIEWTYMDRELPSARSWASMLSAPYLLAWLFPRVHSQGGG